MKTTPVWLREVRACPEPPEPRSVPKSCEKHRNLQVVCPHVIKGYHGMTIIAIIEDIYIYTCHGMILFYPAFLQVLSSGKQPHNELEKSTNLDGKKSRHFNWAMFYVAKCNSHYQGVVCHRWSCSIGKSICFWPILDTLQQKKNKTSLVNVDIPIVGWSFE